MAAGFVTKCNNFGVCSCETHHLEMTSKEKTYEACAAAGATSWRA